ncbi:hypothetical protein JGUZn3_06940 [Entomobacter blattae]|uniref:Uncharacterized protein n=2 Tax=Entomobacter blattae TaxID=2762277 RepID=A0A7H1NQ76_9PROT|nr:hypothetical protein JGUZn3_06940 [Entomobacter blattae]
MNIDLRETITRRMTFSLKPLIPYALFVGGALLWGGFATNAQEVSQEAPQEIPQNAPPISSSQQDHPALQPSRPSNLGKRTEGAAEGTMQKKPLTDQEILSQSQYPSRRLRYTHRSYRHQQIPSHKPHLHKKTTTAPLRPGKN